MQWYRAGLPQVGVKGAYARTTGPFTEVLRFEPMFYELGRNPHYWQPGSARGRTCL